jgi:hypothetical protein
MTTDHESGDVAVEEGEGAEGVATGIEMKMWTGETTSKLKQKNRSRQRRHLQRRTAPAMTPMMWIRYPIGTSPHGTN